MSVSIVPCPQCNTLLLSDTIQCPTCKFVFDTDLAAELADVGGMVPQSAGEIPCPDCGEMCRPELVRCFNCGGFLRDEIAQSYLRKQENPTPVTYSQSPPQQRRDSSAGAESISGNADEDRVATGAVSPGGPSQPARRAGLNRQAGWAGPPVAAPAGDDDDFELSPEIAAEQSEDDFELAPGIGVDEIRCEVSRKVEAALPPAEAESDTYGFAAPVTSSPAALKQPGCSEAAGNASPPMTDDFDIPAAAPAATSAASADAGDIPETGGPGSEQSPEAPAGAPTGKVHDEAPEGPSHSEATAGDVLLDIAIREEQETEERRKNRPKRLRVRTGFIVFCPNGHQVEVHDKHRGKMGKCPRCKSPFFVPEAHWEKQSAAEETAAATGESALATAGSQPAPAAGYRWMTDVHVHTVDPTKLKLKPGSLELTFDALDFGFKQGEGLLAVTLVKGGRFGAADKKKPETREAMQAHLAEDKPLEELPVADRVQFDVEAIKQFKIVQPAPNADESMFAGIPVFGAHRVALRLPKLADSDPLRFVSFPLSGFREFVGILADRPSRLETARGGFFEIEDLADGLGIPMRDEFDQLTCHYSDATLHCLKNIEWYQADPHYTLKLLGRRCQACKLVVSEDSRKKEKIGGLNGKGIAKAKCPKCQNKFGEISLYGLEDRQAGWAGTSPQPAAAGTAGFKPPSAATEEEAADTADATG